MNDAASTLVRCPACYFMLPGPWIPGEENPCECIRCRQFLRVSVFPTVLQPPPMAMQSGAPAMEGDATCFFHPTKRAERPCDRCGRFLCALCDLPVGARHLCPSCLKLGDQEKETVPELVTRRLSWGRLSLLLSLTVLVPLVNLFSFVTAPAAIFTALFGWNKPGSLVHGKRRLSALVGLVLGILIFAGWAFIFYNAWLEGTKRGHH